jgi:hypothetical protein
MSSRRKSPRKSSGVRPDYYRTDDDQDGPNITSRKAEKPPPSKHRHKIGYKERYRKSPPARKKSTNSSPESLYEEESESEGEEKGLAIDDISKKNPRKMGRLDGSGEDERGGQRMMRMLMTLKTKQFVQN